MAALHFSGEIDSAAKQKRIEGDTMSSIYMSMGTHTDTVLCMHIYTHSQWWATARTSKDIKTPILHTWLVAVYSLVIPQNRKHWVTYHRPNQLYSLCIHWRVVNMPSQRWRLQHLSVDEQVCICRVTGRYWDIKGNEAEWTYSFPGLTRTGSP